MNQKPPAEVIPFSKLTRFTDEMNFAEFPLAALSDCLPKHQKTLHFTDTIYDSSKNQSVTRELTISAADEYGLPTAQDDEVILGLLQLTTQRPVLDRKVHFTRYELIKLLKWRDDSKSYARIEESLKRWLGVTLYYDHAWWSKEEQCWVDENFHILDQVTIFDKERRQKNLRSKPSDPNAGLSSFVWNDRVFESFKAGYLKPIDLDFYNSLRSAISKRMYRFLDKRFWRRARHDFELREFACEHIGLSKNYHNGEIKRRLAPAIAELEEAQFLKKVSASERFVKLQRGNWNVVFIKGERANLKPKAEQQPTELELELTQMGVSQAAATELTQEFSEQKIREKISFVALLLQRKDPRISRNPAGFLVSAIRRDFSPERELKTDLARRVAQKPPPALMPNTASSAMLPDKERANLDAFWTALSAHEQLAFEEEALQAADRFLQEQYRRGREGQGSLFKATRQAIIDAHIKRRLELQKAA